MSTNKKITQLDELTPATWADDDVIAIVDISAQETKKIQLSTFRTAVGGVTTLTATTPLTVDTSLGDVTISVAISGGGTVNAVLDEDNMASNSATALSTQQSIKAYVDSQIITVDSLSEVLALGNTTGGTDLSVSTGDDITFPDNSKAIFGTGSDLQIYHNGTNSVIGDFGTGDLLIYGTDDVFIRGNTTSNYMARFAEEGAVTLYYDNAIKLATTATGVDVTGTIVGDGLTLTTGATVTTVLDEDNMASNSATALATQQSIKAYVDANGDGDVVGPASATDNAVVRFDATTGKLIQNSSVIIDDSGNVGIGTSSPTAELDIESTSPEIHLNDSDGVLGAAVTSRMIFQASGSTQGVVGLGTSSGTMAVTNSQGNLLLQADTNNAQASSYVGFTVDNAEKMRIDSAGDVGIGTSTPTEKLEVTGNLILDATDADIKLKSGGAGTTGALRWTFSTDSTSYGDISLPYDTRASVGLLLHTIGGYPITIDSGNSVIFKEDDTETMRITPTGKVGIGTASPSQKLTVEGTDARIYLTGANTDINMTGTADGQLSLDGNGFGFGIALNSSGANLYTNTTSRDLIFGTDETERMRIDGAGLVGIGTASAAVPLDVVGNIRSSTGVLFGTDTAAANLLDDYEEGDWTPTIGQGATASSDATYNGSFTGGKYTKIGRIVHCSGTLRLTDKGTQSGAISILGLPFASASNVGSRVTWSCWFHGAADMDLTGNVTGTIMMYQAGNASYILVRVKDPATASAENVEFADISDTVYLQISGSYVAA